MNTIEPEKHTVTPDAMAFAMNVGPKSSIADVRLVLIQAKLTKVDKESPSLMRTNRAYAFSRDTENARVIATLAFSCDLAHESPESQEDPPVSIEATYAVTYDIEGLADFDDAHLDAFAQINGFYNAYPFWRELLHSLMGKMGLSPLVAPTLRVETAEPANGAAK